MSTSNSQSYSTASIVALQGLEPVRRRPGMYIGDPHDGSGLHHLVWEGVSNVLDQFIQGHATLLAVTLERDGAVSIEDDGVGISVDPIEPSGPTFLERVLTTLGAGSKFDSRHRHVHAGLHGAGLAVVNALSERLTIKVARDGVLRAQSFRRGVPSSPLERIGATNKRGTHLSLLPDPTIFTRTEFDAAIVRERLAEIAALLPGLRVRFFDRRTELGPTGIAALARRLAGTPAVDVLLHAVSGGEREGLAQRAEDGVPAVEAALLWTHGGRGRIRGFVNLERCDEGTHVRALAFAMAPLLVDVPPRERKALSTQLAGRLSGVLSVFHFDPRYGSPSRSRLESDDVAPVVGRVVGEAVARFVGEHPSVAQELVSDARREAAARRARKVC